MLRWLAAHGVHPYLLDWGWPGEVERSFSLTDYIAGRLERAIAAMPGPVVLAGYCMGGLLALAAALRLPDKVSALALLATPWDFHAADPARRRAAWPTCCRAMEPMMRLFRHAADRCAEHAVRHDRPVTAWARNTAISPRRTQPPRGRGGSSPWRTGWPTACRWPPPWRARRWAAGTAPTRRRAGTGAWRGWRWTRRKLSVPAFCAIPGARPAGAAGLRAAAGGSLAKAHHHRADRRTYRHGGRHPCARPRYGSLSRIGCAAYDGQSNDQTSQKGNPAMEDIVIVSAARTPVGSFNGAFARDPGPCARHRRR